MVQCDIGALSEEFIPRASFRHLQARDDGDHRKEIEQKELSAIDQAPENLYTFVEGFRNLTSQKMTEHRLREGWKRLPSIAGGVLGQIMARCEADHDPPLFGGFIPAGKNTFWHRETMTSADFLNNNVFTSGILRRAFEMLKADVVASWNFRHVVNLHRIERFNAVNLLHGYRPLEIRSPRELFVEDDERNDEEAG